MGLRTRLAIQLLLVTVLIGHLPSAWAGIDPMQTKDPYLTLGVERSATVEAIRERYRELLLRYHPDRAVHNGLDAGSATVVAQNLNVAFEWLRKNHIPVAAKAAAPTPKKSNARALGKADLESVLRFAWETGMSAEETLKAMNALTPGNGALARIDQWFDGAKAKPDFILLYLEVSRLHPDARRVERLRSVDAGLLGELAGRYREGLTAIAQAKPELAAAVNGILYPVTRPSVFQSSESIKAELRALRAMPHVNIRNELGALAADAGDGRVSAAGNRLFQEAVAQFISEEFTRVGAPIKNEAVEPFLNLLADDARAFELRLELLRRPTDHATLTDGAIEAARVLRAGTLPESKRFVYAPAQVRLHDYSAKLARLLVAIGDGDAKLSGGRRSETALFEMVLNLAVRAHEAGNPDAKLLARSMVDAIVAKGDSDAAPTLERLAQTLETRRLTETVLGSLQARAELQELIRTLRSVPRSCRAFF